jgi:Tol biopolymer transport system component
LACVCAARASDLVVEQVSVSTAGVAGNGVSGRPMVSADGRFVAFLSLASNLVAGDDNGGGAYPVGADLVEGWDVFVRDLATGVTERASVPATGGEAFGDSTFFSISGDGRFVAFQSNAWNLTPHDNNSTDIFVRDRMLGTLTCASLGLDGKPGNLKSFFPAISDDGRFVAFDSFASNLVLDDHNGMTGGDPFSGRDVFVRDMWTGTTERLSVGYDGAETDGDSFCPPSRRMDASSPS